MKRLAFILAAIMLIGLLPVAACQTDVGGTPPSAPVEDVALSPSEAGQTDETEPHTPVSTDASGIPPVNQNAPDALMPAPGMGPTYQANVFAVSKNGTIIENLWPPVEIAEVSRDGGSGEARVSYRSRIITAAGESRNNIIRVTIPEKEVNSLTLYADDLPAGIKLAVGSEWSGPFARTAFLIIGTAPDTTPGEYVLEIDLVINGQDYGTVTCRLTVTNSLAGIVIEPTPGSYLSDYNGETSGVILEDARVSVEACDRDYHPHHFGPLEEGEPCLVVSGHIQNTDEDKFEIGMSAAGYDAAGEMVAETLDAAHIVGAIALHLEYQETGAFFLHLNPSDNISTIRIYGGNATKPLP